MSLTGPYEYETIAPIRVRDPKSGDGAAYGPSQRAQRCGVAMAEPVSNGDELVQRLLPDSGRRWQLQWRSPQTVPQQTL